MKRDMELIRKLLLDLEESGSVSLSEYDQETLNYHKDLLRKAGLAEGRVLRGDDVVKVIDLTELTWNGHEFLDLARNETGWKHVMRRLGSSAATTSLSVIQALLVESAKTALGR